MDTGEGADHRAIMKLMTFRLLPILSSWEPTAKPGTYFNEQERMVRHEQTNCTEKDGV